MNELFFFLHIGLMIALVKGAEKWCRTALMSLSALLAVWGNFFVLKEVSLFGYHVTASDVYVIGSLLCLNLIQRKEGSQASRQSIVVSFSALLCFALFSQLHLLYEPTSQDHYSNHYAALLTPSFRLLVASLVTFGIVQYLDIWILDQLSKLEMRWGSRLSLSLLTSQAVDTFLFTVLGLYGTVEKPWEVFWVSFCIKCMVILTSTIFWKDAEEQKHEI
jgi:uncharacterized integral membrane protein (TIGR00697 family)